MTGPYGVVLVKLSTEIIIGCEVPKVIAVNLLPRINTLPDDQRHIDHMLRPWCVIMIAVDEDILEGLKLPACPFLHAESDLIVYIIVQVIEIADCLVYLIPEEDRPLED
jgi:hypothetical protein